MTEAGCFWLLEHSWPVGAALVYRMVNKVAPEAQTVEYARAILKDDQLKRWLAFCCDEVAGAEEVS